MNTTLAQSMREAWQQRGMAAHAILTHAIAAPALFKPETVEQARRDMARAVAEVGRWSA